MTKFYKKSPQAQVWELLKTEEQKAYMADALRHVKKKDQEDLCYGIIAYLRWHITRPFEDAWLDAYSKSILLFLKTERELGLL